MILLLSVGKALIQVDCHMSQGKLTSDKVSLLDVQYASLAEHDIVTEAHHQSQVLYAAAC